VWRRIAEAEAPERAEGNSSWLERVVAWMLRPRFAVAAATLLIVAGTALGVREADQSARQQAEARYLAAVAPGALR
jgi:hypothetical protein